MKFKKDKLVSQSSFLETPVYYDSTYKIYFNPIKKKEDLQKFYSDEYWNKFKREKKESFSQKIDKFFHEYLNLLSPTYMSDILILNKFKKIKNRNILEIGCGNGEITKFFVKESKNVVSLDMDLKNIKKINSELNKKVVLEKNYEDEILEGRYDIIFLRHVFEHFFDLKKVLKKLEKNLTKQGIVYLNIPNVENKVILKESIQNHPHTFHFTKYAINKILEEEALEVIHLETYSIKTTNKISLLYKRIFQKNNLIINKMNKGEFIIAIFKKKEKVKKL